MERLINEEIVKNHFVSWQELPYEEVKKRSEIMQFFGDKYGDRVRVVQIGGAIKSLNGFSAFRINTISNTPFTLSVKILRIPSTAKSCANGQGAVMK